MTTADPVQQFRAARRSRDLAILEGFHALKHAIRFGADLSSVATVDVDALRVMAQRFAPDVAERAVAMAECVPPAIFAQLSPTPPDTGVIAIAARRHATVAAIAALPPVAPIVVLDHPSHSGNIGAVIRAAAGAGATAVITTGTNDPWNPGAIRGSAGLHYALPVCAADDLLALRQPWIAIDPDGDDLATHPLPGNAVFLFGSERAGVSAELMQRATARLRIPMRRNVSSLNLATAVAVVLYAWKLRQ